MRITRILTTLSSALAIAAMVLVTGVRADEYNKLTYLTFSGPVQVPGITLPAGKYMFKLADPASGRRAIQIWDESGKELFATLLTIPDEQSEASDEPVVLFSERPSGTAQAVKSWFYPADRIGYEFIYPKDQAMKIAEASNSSVLAYNEQLKSDADEDAMRSAQVGRIDAQGRTAESATASAATSSSTTAANTAADSPAAAQPDPPAAPAAPSTTATAAATPDPSANRTQTPAAAPPATTTTAASATTTAADRSAATPVGTSGQTAAAQDTASRTAQPGDPERSRPDALPRTASPLATIALMSVALFAGAFGVRQMRRRYAFNR